jgi:hypothetical protein
VQVSKPSSDEIYCIAHFGSLAKKLKRRLSK